MLSIFKRFSRKPDVVKTEIETCGIHIFDLPSEIITLIFTFVEVKSLLKCCPLVSSKVYNVVSSRDFWVAVFCAQYGEKALHYLSSIILQSSELKRMVFFRAFENNLIANPSGGMKSLKSWQVIADGGNGITVESVSIGTNCPPGVGITMSMEELINCNRAKWLDLPTETCFATSYGLGDKQQIIDLENKGLEKVLDLLRPPIAVGEWVGSRWDCGAEYHMEVVLLGEENEPLEKFTKTVRVDQWQGGSWIPITHVFENYQSGVRKVKFRHSGVDRQFWQGHFGSKFTLATVKVLLPCY